MERKRVAGRFAAEDKGGVVKKRATASSRIKPAALQHAEVIVEPALKSPPQKPEQQSKGLIGQLLDGLKKKLAPHNEVRSDNSN